MIGGAGSRNTARRGRRAGGIERRSIRGRAAVRTEPAPLRNRARAGRARHRRFPHWSFTGPADGRGGAYTLRRSGRTRRGERPPACTVAASLLTPATGSRHNQVVWGRVRGCRGGGAKPRARARAPEGFASNASGKSPERIQRHSPACDPSNCAVRAGGADRPETSLDPAQSPPGIAACPWVLVWDWGKPSSPLGTASRERALRPGSPSARLRCKPAADPQKHEESGLETCVLCSGCRTGSLMLSPLRLFFGQAAGRSRDAERDRCRTRTRTAPRPRSPRRAPGPACPRTLPSDRGRSFHSRREAAIGSAHERGWRAVRAARPSA